jgi:hypothetical protein
LEVAIDLGLRLTDEGNADRFGGRRIELLAMIVEGGITRQIVNANNIGIS